MKIYDESTENKSLRWDLRPLFPKADPNGTLILWTRHSAISLALALVGFVVVTWNMGYWTTVAIAVIAALAFNAGDTRVPFDDGDEYDGDKDPS